ncbi:MAG: Rrf2 family transcriptional regulator [Christensenellaceae bacterium]|nr:Rrf2 family transcriptional regulator [bacterium]
MKYSARLSDATHLLVYIYLSEGNCVSSSDIAVSIKTNPSYIRQLMSKLKAAGLLKSMRGAAKPELSKSPEKISILDIYRAVEGNTPLLHLDTNINPECGIGVNVQLALQTFYEDIQKTTECAMADITLADVIKKYNFLISL